MTAIKAMNNDIHQSDEAFSDEEDGDQEATTMKEGRKEGTKEGTKEGREGRN